VKRYIDTSLETGEIEKMIEEADQELTDRDLTGRATYAKRRICALIAASLCAIREPLDRGGQEEGVGNYASSADLRKDAEEAILQSQGTGLLIIVHTDDIE
jgi:hypothetical protein